MFDLWVGIAVLLVLALLILFMPMIISLRGSDSKRQQSNLVIYKSQLSDLESDLALGRIDQPEFDALSQEVKLNLLADTEAQSIASEDNQNKGNWILFPSAMLAVVVSVGLYVHLGAENELAITEALKKSNKAGFTQTDALDLVDRIEQQTKDTPNDVEMWYLFGRLNFDLERYDAAVLGFTSVLQLLPVESKEDQAVAMSHLAQAQFFASDRQLDSATKSLLKDVLNINPNDETALGLLGISSFDAKQYVEAVGYWQKLLSMMPVNNPNVAAIQGGINTALERMAPAEREKIEHAQAAIQPAVIQVTVDVSVDVKQKVPKNADVFILAKADKGPAMPLAVQRISVNEWPITVVLDDSMAMMPALRLSQFEDIIITARISKSGVGNAKPGDLQGDSDVVSSQSKKVALTINTEL
ncbi:c-type cytochrome biogenesis protein CcmI [Oceaniserpentilla sp. 4NH20-0058]|uniref:c-type cytochrome biogenesis protein CcmI n=1 Tax=Oceaniserpentilla sp. 4NH20-0058 TaxID=3127660 RepID=UPI00310380CA